MRVSESELISVTSITLDVKVRDTEISIVRCPCASSRAHSLPGRGANVFNPKDSEVGLLMYGDDCAVNGHYSIG